MEHQVTPHLWLQVPQEARFKLAEQFGLSKSGASEISHGPSGSELVSDGHTAHDLLGITQEKVEAYVGSKGNFYDLFGVAVDKALGKETKKKSKE